MYGNRIRLLRRQKGWTQSEMASRLNMSAAAYSKLETNHTSLSAEMLQLISCLFEVSPLVIITEEGDKAKDHTSNEPSEKSEAVFSNQREHFEYLLSAKESEIETLKLANENKQQIIHQQSQIIEQLINQVTNTNKPPDKK